MRLISKNNQLSSKLKISLVIVKADAARGECVSASQKSPKRIRKPSQSTQFHSPKRLVLYSYGRTRAFAYALSRRTGWGAAASGGTADWSAGGPRCWSRSRWARRRSAARAAARPPRRRSRRARRTAATARASPTARPTPAACSTRAGTANKHKANIAHQMNHRRNKDRSAMETVVRNYLCNVMRRESAKLH